MKNNKIYCFISILFCFFLQNIFIYKSFYNKNKFPKINHSGVKIWKKYNCQTCHQIYGFGGFLGPDLTNKGFIYKKKQIKHILYCNKIKQMPIIKIKSNKIKKLTLFFNYLNNTGVSKFNYKNNKYIPYFEF